MLCIYIYIYKLYNFDKLLGDYASSTEDFSDLEKDIWVTVSKALGRPSLPLDS